MRQDQARNGERRPQGRTRALLGRAALEFGPLLLFFLANAVWGIFTATAVLIAAALASCAYALLREGRLPVLPLVGAVLVLILGGLTLALGQPWLIKLRPTLMNGGIAAALLVGLLNGRLLLRRIFGRDIRLPEQAWRRLTRRAIAYLAMLAMLNEVVRLTVSTDAWVAFKTFGVISLNLLFVASQIPLLRRHRLAEERRAPDAATAREPG